MGGVGGPTQGHYPKMGIIFALSPGSTELEVYTIRTQCKTTQKGVKEGGKNKSFLFDSFVLRDRLGLG